MIDANETDEIRRPLGLSLLAGLYLFFFLVSASTFGNPFPFLGHIHEAGAAQALVFADSLACLYLFLGIMKRQLLTWYLLLGYNLFEILNTIINLNYISRTELEKVLGARVSEETLLINNVAAALAILLLSQYIYRHKNYFSNREKYLF
ncbi:MAG: hypothetical protein NDI77_14185 [Geobacteraceae bacterium]|nr:hypothetical protein [Geobacteraceae bacterium]